LRRGEGRRDGKVVERDKSLIVDGIALTVVKRKEYSDILTCRNPFKVDPSMVYYGRQITPASLEIKGKIRILVHYPKFNS
jgi:hypothetical protein